MASFASLVRTVIFLIGKTSGEQLSICGFTHKGDKVAINLSNKYILTRDECADIVANSFNRLQQTMEVV